ncbi:MAG: DUF3604 domain-containing protein [Planctomycetota bacterium]|jgi:hypothetical protein
MRIAAAVLLLATIASAQTDASMEAKDMKRPAKEFSPYANRGFPTRVYWGDTHLHTELSIDAGTFGNRLDMETGYRFCRGEEVTSSGGLKVRLGRPLDWVVISDHSEGMGLFQKIAMGDPEMMKLEQGRRWNRMIQAGGQEAVNAAMQMITAYAQDQFPWPVNSPKLMRPVWDRVTRTADRYNEPGKFTTLHGYEWTSMVKGNNLHRVVIFRDGAERVGRTLPFTSADSKDPEDLWRALASYEKQTGGRVLSIAHNGNLANGVMFDTQTLSGKPVTESYARTRDYFERLYETTQIKGDGEAHPYLSPDDEFADYETWDKGNLDLSQAKTKQMLAGEYARSGLLRGIEFAKSLGINPYKFGQVGSTDAHTSLPAVEEENFFGKHSGTEPSRKRAEYAVLFGEAGKMYGWEMASSGYAAVWATENTREAIWDAMHRRETYATTGPRMLVRFFGGWEFTVEDAQSRMPARIGYSKGVPMGGDLSKAPAGKSPTFLVAALKDSYSGNLDRIQIIKGWVGADGKAKERIYDVAVSDGRTIGEDGRCRKPVGNTVDVARATWTNTIGDPELIAVWTDPRFDAGQHAFYYVRVIEIPTPRWTAYEALRFGIEMPDGCPMTTRERAYTSPIWYTP